MSPNIPIPLKRLLIGLLLAVLMVACDSNGTEPEPEPEPIVPVADLPATFEGDLRQFHVESDDHVCTAPASFSVNEDGSGSYDIGLYTFPDDRSRGCEAWFPPPGGTFGTFTGAWVTPDSLDFHTVQFCEEDCLTHFHDPENPEDTWRVYVTSETMRFVGIEWAGHYRFEFEGIRQ